MKNTPKFSKLYKRGWEIGFQMISETLELPKRAEQIDLQYGIGPVIYGLNYYAKK